MTTSGGYRISVDGIGMGHAWTMLQARQIANWLQMRNCHACVRIELLQH